MMKHKLMKYKLEILTLVGITYSIMKVCLEIYFMLVGGVVIWASPLVPMSEWGQANMYPNIIVLIVLLLSSFIIIRSMKNKVV